MVQETLVERVEDDQEAGPLGRVVTLQSSSTQLAIVHWQRDEPPEQTLIETYLQQSWQLQPSQLSPVEEHWFRNGGYQLRMTLQEPLTWVRSSRYQDTDH